MPEIALSTTEFGIQLIRRYGYHPHSGLVCEKLRKCVCDRGYWDELLTFAAAAYREPPTHQLITDAHPVADAAIRPFAASSSSARQYSARRLTCRKRFTPAIDAAGLLQSVLPLSRSGRNRFKSERGNGRPTRERPENRKQSLVCK